MKVSMKAGYQMHPIHMGMEAPLHSSRSSAASSPPPNPPLRQLFKRIAGAYDMHQRSKSSDQIRSYYISSSRTRLIRCLTQRPWALSGSSSN